MYKVYVPFMTRKRSDEEWKISIDELKRSDCEAVMLIYYRQLANKAERQNMTELFIDNKKKLEAAGFVVYAWLAPSIGYGSSVNAADLDAEKKYRKIMGVKGEETFAFCPLDENFATDLYEQCAEIASTGVELIMIEDDFTLTGGKLWSESPGCCCEVHMQKLKEILGEEVERETLRDYLCTGKRNKYRDAYQKLGGETLLGLAKGIEKAVHNVNPKVRLGLCANSASYHLEGVDFMELESALAGDTEPFVRLTGAPYWKDNASTINPTIETARMQSAWLREANIENWTEGDTYPRPRFLTPAAYLEMFDMILRADGNSDGILKYMYDYNSSDSYEKGYVRLHEDNSVAYREVERRFKGKTVGLNVIERPVRTTEMDFDNTFDYTGFTSHGTLPLISQWLVTESSVPTTYEKCEGASLAFGYNARFLSDEDLKNGAIIDINAAKYLDGIGIDVGFRELKKAPKPAMEYFREYDDKTSANTEGKEGYFEVELDKKAEVLSEFYGGGLGGLAAPAEIDEAPVRYPSCYRYENDKGQRFMVYTFAPTLIKSKGCWSNGLFRNYYRQRQLIEGYEWLCGKKLPALCPNAPYLYILCKREGEKLHIGLFNIFPDPIFNPIIELEREYAKADFYNCDGSLKNDRLILKYKLQPYSYGFITVE